MDQLTINLALQVARERNDQLTGKSRSRLHRPADASGTDGPCQAAPEARTPRRLVARRPRFGRGATAY